MNKEKQTKNIKDIDIPEYQFLTFAFSAVVSAAIFALLISFRTPIIPADTIISPELIVAFAVPAVALVSLLVLFTLLEKKLTKTTVDIKGEKLIKFDNESFVITNKLYNRRSVGFVIKNGEHQIVGDVLLGDIKVSKENFSYVSELTTKTTSSIFFFK